MKYRMIKLQREGDNLHYELYVSIPDAILGTNKEIETVSGKVRIKIEPGMQSGKILRLRGKGIPSINGYGYWGFTRTCKCLDTQDT